MDSPPHSKRIRILFLCHDGKVYGAQKSLKLLIEHLPADRYEIFVSFSRKGPLMEAFGKMPHITVLMHERLQGVKHSHRSLFKQIGDNIALLFNLHRVFALVQIIREHQIDVVHTNSLVSFEGGLAAKIAGVPHIWHIRELFQDYNPRFHLILGKPLTKALVHYLSDRVLCVSEYVRQQFQPYVNQAAQKYQVLYNAIQTSAYHPIELENPSSEMLNIVYIGRISDGKRFQDIIDAFCLLKARWANNMPFQIQIYGDFICPNFEEMVQSKVMTSQLTDCFRLMGYTSNIDKCFETAELLLMPSSTEAFGRIMLEALVRGVPVVTSRSGGPLEVIEENFCGFFHNPNDPKDLADCLEKIYHHKAQITEMRQNCVQHVAGKFDLDQQIRQLELVYQEVLAKTPPKPRHQVCLSHS